LKEENIKKKQQTRINDRITVSPIRLINQHGEQVGIIPTREALTRAREAGLDLVEVAPTGKPPVCRIMDYGKFKYEQSKKERVAKKKQHTVQMRAMRYRPKTEEHDYQFKTRHVREFLMQGSKVKTFVMFSGREMAHTELGQKILDRVVTDVADIATVGQDPKMEGRHLSMILNPDMQKIKELKKREKDAENKDESVGREEISQDGDR
jgi:translation initiation factor IF-3